MQSNTSQLNICNASKIGFDFYNDYLGIRLAFNQGYEFNPKKTYCGQKTYEKRKDLQLIEYMARKYSPDWKEYIVTGFLEIPKFTIHDFHTKDTTIERNHTQRMIRLNGLDYYINNEIKQLERYDFGNIEDMLKSVDGSIPNVLKYRLKYNFTWEFLVVLNEATNFLRQDAADKEFIYVKNKLVGYRKFLLIDTQTTNSMIEKFLIRK